MDTAAWCSVMCAGDYPDWNEVIKAATAAAAAKGPEQLPSPVLPPAGPDEALAAAPA